MVHKFDSESSRFIELARATVNNEIEIYQQCAMWREFYKLRNGQQWYVYRLIKSKINAEG